MRPLARGPRRSRRRAASITNMPAVSFRARKFAGLFWRRAGILPAHAREQQLVATNDNAAERQCNGNSETRKSTSAWENRTA